MKNLNFRFLVSLSILSFALVSINTVEAAQKKKGIKSQLKEVAVQTCEKVFSGAGTIAGELATSVSNTIEKFAPAEAVKTNQVLLMSRLTESQAEAKKRGVSNDDLIQSVANSSVRSGVPAAKLYSDTFELMKLPAEKQPNQTATFAVLRLSSIHGLDAGAVYDALYEIAKIQGEEAHWDSVVTLTELALVYKKSPKETWEKFNEVKAMTKDIAAIYESVHQERTAGMDEFTKLLTVGIRIGDAPTVAPTHILVALTEACLAKGLSAQQAVDQFSGMLQHDSVRFYSQHEHVSLFKALVFRNRAITETFPAIQKVESLSKEVLGDSLNTYIERPLMNIVLLTGMSPEDAIAMVKSLANSKLKLTEEWHVSAIFNRILLQRDRSPEAQVEAALPL